MTESTREEKMARFFSIIGFIVMVVLLAWLAVQFVRFLPTAFTSLADIFEDNQQALREKSGSNNDDSNDSVVVIVEDEDDSAADQDTSWDLPDIDTDPTTPDDAVIEDDTEEVETNTDDTVYYTTIETYSVPQSDPNGYTDLEISFIAVGRMSSDDRFYPGESLSEGDHGAIQFQVKNIGTKTSDVWQFLTELPSGAVTESQMQEPLQPKEYAILTVAFTAPSSGTKQIGAAVNNSVDATSYNNSFKTTVYISN